MGKTYPFRAFVFFVESRGPPRLTLFPYTTLFRSLGLGLRELAQPAFDERREEGARGLAVSLLPLRQRGAQPHSIDHGGDHRREAARLLARDHPAQIAAQVRQHATLVSRSEERRVG